MELGTNIVQSTVFLYQDLLEEVKNTLLEFVLKLSVIHYEI